MPDRLGHTGELEVVNTFNAGRFGGPERAIVLVRHPTDELRARHRAMPLVSLDGADAATHDQAHAGRPPDTRRGRQGPWSARGRLAGRASDAVGAAGGMAPEERLPVGTTRAGRNAHAVGRREELDGDGGRRRSTRPALTAVGMRAYKTQQRRTDVGPEPPARQPRALGGHSRS